LDPPVDVKDKLTANHGQPPEFFDRLFASARELARCLRRIL